MRRHIIDFKEGYGDNPNPRVDTNFDVINADSGYSKEDMLAVYKLGVGESTMIVELTAKQRVTCVMDDNYKLTAEVGDDAEDRDDATEPDWRLYVTCGCGHSASLDADEQRHHLDCFQHDTMVDDLSRYICGKCDTVLLVENELEPSKEELAEVALRYTVLPETSLINGVSDETQKGVENDTSNYRRTKVCFDDLGSVEAYVTDNKWNGAEMPYFTRDNVTKVFDLLHNMSGMMDGMICDFVNDRVYITDTNNDDGETIRYDAMEIEVDGLLFQVWAIGAGHWMWHEDRQAGFHQAISNCCMATIYCKGETSIFIPCETQPIAGTFDFTNNASLIEPVCSQCLKVVEWGEWTLTMIDQGEHT